MRRIKIAATVCLLLLQTFSATTIKAEDQMGKDSTNLVPFDGLSLAPPVTITTTANGVMPGVIGQNGQCGASNNSMLSGPPTSFLCANGQASSVNTVIDYVEGRVGHENYYWTCTGNNTADPNNVAQCSAYKKILGSCGTANGQILQSPPSSTGTEMCADGDPVLYNLTGNQAKWRCQGTEMTMPSNWCSATINPPAWESWIGHSINIGFGGNYLTIDAAGMARVNIQTTRAYINCPANGCSRTGDPSGSYWLDIKNILTVPFDLTRRIVAYGANANNPVLPDPGNVFIRNQYINEPNGGAPNIVDWQPADPNSFPVNMVLAIFGTLTLNGVFDDITGNFVRDFYGAGSQTNNITINL